MNQFRSFILLLLVLLVFAPTVASATPTEIDQPALAYSYVTKKNAGHSQSEIQFTYEEREKEEESGGEQKSKQSLIHAITESLRPELPFLHHTIFSFERHGVISLHVPIYLVKRSLLL